MQLPLLTRTGLRRFSFPIAVGMTLFQLYFTIGFGVLDGAMMSSIFVSFAMVLIFLNYPARNFPEGQNEPQALLLLDLGLAGLAVTISGWFCLHIDFLMERMSYIDAVPPAAIFLGLALVFLTFEITRRTTGLPLAVVGAVFFAYFIWGDLLPRSISHNGSSLADIVECMYLQSDGVYGIPVQLATSVLFAFIVFGAFLERSKLSGIFMDLACLLTRGAQGGPAKVAIFASALFGTISGSSAGNVYTTGTFTIPLMKKCGYKPAFAGAVEAVASTGGQIMPPIMGAAAFMMAELAGVSYLTVAKAAFLPALLYYIALFVMIHFEARRHGLGYLADELIPPREQVLRKLYYLLPLAVLIGMMLRGRSISVCANTATLSVFLLAMLGRETRFSLKSFIETLAAAARTSLMIVACCACAGVVVGVINHTGVGFKFINLITTLAGDNLLILLLVLMLTSFILGMGMPTTPAYIVVATLGAPALIKAGVEPIVAHMFVFYYAILSFITPPVCVAAYAGASIAKANPMRTGFTSMKLGIVAFIVPIMFIYQPALLWQDDLASSAQATVTAVFGVLGLSGGLQGWFLRRCNHAERALLLAGGLALFYPGTMTDLLGCAGMSLVALEQLLRNRRDPVPPPQAICRYQEES